MRDVLAAAPLALAGRFVISASSIRQTTRPSWIALGAIAVLAGCAAGAVQATPPVTTRATWAQSATGRWEGSSIAGCQPLQPDARRCNAVEKIMLRIFQQDSSLSGDYTCNTGTMVCRENNNHGVIVNGELRDEDIVALRVMLPDGSSCLFNGHLGTKTMAGNYFCMQGGGFIEQGRFRLKKSW